MSALASGSVAGPIAVHTAHNIAALLYGGKTYLGTEAHFTICRVAEQVPKLAVVAKKRGKGNLNMRRCRPLEGIGSPRAASFLQA